MAGRRTIGGVYAWRLSAQAPAEFQPKTEAERQALLREADFAFRQAFALAPESPEAVFRYVQLLVEHQRFSEAILVAETALKLEPESLSLLDLIKNLKSMKP